MLTIPANAGPGEFSRAAGEVITERAFDTPIVREVEFSPSWVGEIRGLESCRFGLGRTVRHGSVPGKEPPLVERLMIGFINGPRRAGDEGECEEQGESIVVAHSG